MSEKRLIAFRTLRGVCEYRLYRNMCTHEKHPSYDGYVRGKCCADRCPIFRRLKKKEDGE